MEAEGVSRVSRRRIAVRRGIVIGLLVVCVLMLTSFFREGEGGFLHSVKGTVTDIVNPVQGAASAAIRPFQNFVGWIRDSRSAANERDRLREEVAHLQAELARRDDNERTSDEYRENLAIQLQLGEDPAIAGAYDITTARVASRPLFETRQSARIDKGSNDGITRNSLAFVPARVVDGQRTFGALVGRVTRVDANSARVTFITDPLVPVAANLLDGDESVPLGLLRATSSGDLFLSGVPAKVRIQLLDRIVTRGAGIQTLSSPYPPGLLIGYVSSVGRANMNSTWTVQVRPFREPQELGTLTILIPKSAEAKARAGIG